MKYCPICQQQYISNQRFCPVDGSRLSLRDPYHLVGRTLEKYQIDALVGIGGMGAVYSAHQIGVGRRVAFKILQPNIVLSDKEVVELFAREAQIAGRLSHENIAVIYDTGCVENSIWYIAMEWLEGNTLDEELTISGPLSIDRTAGLLRQISSALDMAHSEYIVHRDLKPSNIMLVKRRDSEEQLKVLDFGIGKAISNSVGSPASKLMGTPHYASPEQFQKDINIDRRTDIYSLGVILYEVLTGKLPFNSPSIQEVIYLHLTASPKPLRELRPEVPESIERLINRMLAKNPDQRPNRAGEIADSFEEATKTIDRLPIEQSTTLEIDQSVAPLISISDLPTKLIDNRPDRRVQTENDLLGDLEPFGEADCESELKVLGSNEYSKYYFYHSRFNQDALNPKVYLIIGRRGAGKTALSQFFSFQQQIPNVTTIEVDDPAAFQQIMSKIAESAASNREIAVPRLVKIWEFVVWSIIFRQFQYRDSRIRAACLLRDEPAKVSTFIRHILRTIVSKYLTSSNSLSDELEDLINSETVETAKRTVLEIVKDNKVIISIDTMENYAVRDESMMRSMAALIQCASRFCRNYARYGIYLKVFMMAEIFPYLKEEVSLNPLKFIHDEIYLHWRPKDLMRLICWRYYRYLNDQKLIDTKTGKVKWDNHHDVLREWWEPYWGKKLHTLQGLIEETFPYVLRHTQLRPRQMIVLCNSVAKHARESETFPEFRQESIIQGIQQSEERLAEEVMNSYSSVYPGAARIAEALSGLPLIFKGNELDKRAPKTASQWPPGEYSSYAFRQFVSELGIAGRVRSISEKTGIVEADFEYGGENRISLQVNDDCVIHPMFYRKLGIRMTKNLCVYPFPDHEEFKFEVTSAL